MTTTRIPFHVEINRIIELLAKQIYQDEFALLRENTQNAYDAILMRQHRGDDFEPSIHLKFTQESITVEDNGYGMTQHDLENHYWRAGASGKNTDEARAAGVVGTFGVGGMANFGIASSIELESESSITSDRTRCSAQRQSLSATEDCIEMKKIPSQGTPGTRVCATLSDGQMVSVDRAKTYIRDFVRFLPVPVYFNGELISQDKPRSVFGPPDSATLLAECDISTGRMSGRAKIFSFRSNAEAYIEIYDLRINGNPIRGQIFLRQGEGSVKSFRSSFGLAQVAVSSVFGLGGFIDLPVLEPTAGREALTHDSIQAIQNLMIKCDAVIAEAISKTDQPGNNTQFLDWCARHARPDLLRKITVRVEPDIREWTLQDVENHTKKEPINYYEGSDAAVIEQFASSENPLLVLSQRNPRRRAESMFIQRFCKVNKISDAPQVLSRRPDLSLSWPENSFSFRVSSILESDYFVQANVAFGKISHGVPVAIDSTSTPIDIVIDADAPSTKALLDLYRSQSDAATGMAKDYVRSVIFPKISNRVPSSTREGADALLKAIRRKREVFEYDWDDLGGLSEIWQGVAEGRISTEEATVRSQRIAASSVQIVESTQDIAQVLPDVVENQRAIESSSENLSIGAIPAITRLGQESDAKLLTVEGGANAINGYRCFIALSRRVREEHAEFFLQPHSTEIVWGGQKAIYIFTHHSGEFGLYYELVGSDLFAEASGGRAFPTSTIIIKNQTYVGVPPELQAQFIPKDGGKKRFEVRSDMLFLEEQS